MSPRITVHSWTSKFTHAPNILYSLQHNTQAEYQTHVQVMKVVFCLPDHWWVGSGVQPYQHMHLGGSGEASGMQMKPSDRVTVHL